MDIPLTILAFVVQILGLEICADTMVGDGMIRGISGGQKKRVTTGMCDMQLRKAQNWPFDHGSKI
jgi:hypothetical protein